MAHPVLRYSILIVILCFVYGNDDENRQEAIHKEAGIDHENDKHIIADDYFGDEFWDQFSPISDLPKIDGVEFVGNHLKYTDQTEYDTQDEAIEENESVGKNENDKNNKLKSPNDQLKHLNESYENETSEIIKKKKRTNKSEVWEHLKKNGHSKICNYCHKEFKNFSNSSSTSNNWKHLRNNHRQQYDSTEYAKTRKEHENKKLKAQQKGKEETASN